MEGESEDFSGLPPRHRSRSDGRSERGGGRFVKIAVIGGFMFGLALIAISLIVLFAPTPYLGLDASAIARSVGGVTERGCRPVEGGWICHRSDGSSSVPYKVKADWASCWTATRVDSPAGQPEQISGCVSIMDHITAD